MIPASAARISRTLTRAAGTRRRPGGPGRMSPREEAGPGRRPEDRHGPGVGDGGRDRPDAHPLDHSERPGDLDDGIGQPRPAVVGLGTGQDEEVALLVPDELDLELRPGHLGEPAVLDLEGRAAGPVVEQPIGVERRDAVPPAAISAAAVVAALPASTQPSRATTSAGRLSGPGSSSR